jgi:REP element-mobilizing transposase RayT
MRIAARTRRGFYGSVRKPREWVEGAIYHLSPAGNAGRRVFVDDVDREKFEALAAEIAPRYDVSIIGYCLMGNHLHLLVLGGTDGLSRFMQVLLGRYSRWANLRHDGDGGIFETRFHSTPVVDDAHLLTVAAYIDLNPVKDGFVRRPEDWLWSSYRAHVELDEPAELLSLEAFFEFLEPDAYRRFVDALVSDTGSFGV